MTKTELIKEIAGMKSTLLIMESRIEELEASTTPAPPYHGGDSLEAETAYLKMLARTGGHEAIREYQRGRRHNAPQGNHKGLPLQRGGIEEGVA